MSLNAPFRRWTARLLNLAIVAGLALYGSAGSPQKSLARGAALPKACGDVTLRLSPGFHYQDLSLTPAADIPARAVVLRLPLYPSARASSVPLARPDIQYEDTPYLKTALAEYAVKEDLDTVLAWYKQTFPNCGYSLAGSGTTMQWADVISRGLWFISTADRHIAVSMAFERDPSGGTLILYLAYATVLPPRPAASYLPKDMRKVQVNYTYLLRGGGIKKERRIFTKAQKVHALVNAVNSLTDVASGARLQGVGCAFPGRSARMKFTRSNGKSVVVKEDGSCLLVWVGSSRALDDTPDARVWKAVTRLVLGHSPLAEHM